MSVSGEGFWRSILKQWLEIARPDSQPFGIVNGRNTGPRFGQTSRTITRYAAGSARKSKQLNCRQTYFVDHTPVFCSAGSQTPGAPDQAAPSSGWSVQAPCHGERCTSCATTEEVCARARCLGGSLCGCVWCTGSVGRIDWRDAVNGVRRRQLSKLDNAPIRGNFQRLDEGSQRVCRNVLVRSWGRRIKALQRRSVAAGSE